TLAPVDLAITNWKGFISARQGWQRLSKLFATLPSLPVQLQLPAPVASIAAEGVSVAAPGAQKVLVADVNFILRAGCALGIIGASASGKSSLARALVGVWRPIRGTVRLDGAAIEQWCPNALGAHIGYLPQDVELFEGSIAENIARFVPNAPDASVIEA